MLNSQWDILPKDIRSLLISPAFEQKILTVSQRTVLNAEQTASLRQETLFVLLGLVHLFNYTDNIEKELHVSKDQAKMIAQEVGREVFASVRDSLRNVGRLIEEQEKTEKNAAPSIVKEAAKQAQNPPPNPFPPPVQQPQVQKTIIHDIDRQKLLPEHASPDKIQGTIIDDKLKGMTKIPREEVRVNVGEQYKGTDPYREPLK